MTIDEALALRVDDWVLSRDDACSYRITEVPWANDERTDVRVFLAGYRNGEWVSPLGFARDSVPRGRVRTRQARP